MARAHDSMIYPPIEDLLDKVDSKFSLVTLAAAGPGRSTRTSPTSVRRVRRSSPPQVSSVARKPLSIGFEEIAADKIVPVPAGPRPRRPTPRPSCPRARSRPRGPPGVLRRREAHRPRCHRGHRRLQGGRGQPSARRRRRPRRPGDDRRPPSASSAAPPCPPWPASRCRPASGTRTRRSRTPGSARPPT